MDIVARAKGRITHPWEERTVIAGEPSSAAGVFQGHVIPVPATPPTTGLSGLALSAPAFSAVLPGFPAGGPPVRSAVSYVLGPLGLLGVYILHKGPAVVTGVLADEAFVSTLALIGCDLVLYNLHGLVAAPLLVW